MKMTASEKRRKAIAAFKAGNSFFKDATIAKMIKAEERYNKKRSVVKSNPVKRKLKRKTTKRTRLRKATPGKKPRVTVARKNPLFRTKKSRTHPKYMLRAKFHHRDGYFYYGKDQKFYSRPKEPMTFETEDIAKGYVFRVQSSLAKRFPFLHTLRAVRAA